MLNLGAEKIERLEIVEVVPPEQAGIGTHRDRTAGGPGGEGAQFFHEPCGALELVNPPLGPERVLLHPAPVFLGQPLL